MRANRSLEIGTGLFVLLGLAALLFLSMQLPANGLRFGFTKPAGYQVTAEFDNIGGLKVGAPVRMAGVRIGDVTRVGFDTNTERAEVWLRIDSSFNQIPADSSASIDTEGILGAQYISISPGGLPTYLKAGSQIIQTQSALVLENLINKFFANFASKGSAQSSGGGAKEQK
jgi:phospholipid/cholesterol/gamma-HCH transport system substrate-binding protein